MSFLTFLWNNWKIIAVVMIIAIVFGAGHRLGAASVQDKWDAANLKQQQAEITAEKGVILKERADNEATSEVSHAYENRLSSIDNLYADAFAGLRQSQPATAAGGISAIPPGVAGHNGAACPNRLPRRIEENLVELMKQADIQTARLVACQAWITAHQATAGN